MLMALLFVFGNEPSFGRRSATAVLIEKAVPEGQRIGWFAGIAAVAVGVAMVLGLSTTDLRVAG